MHDPPKGNFRRYDPHQTLLLSPNLEEWLPKDHLARFISDLVDHEFDLTPFFESYENEEGGNPAFHPALMLKLWLYGYCVGTVSSRRVARATHEDLAFRYLAADQHPTFTPLARFRERNLANMDRLFLEVLRLCQEANLVGLGRVALDGTKVKASASKHKAMSHGKMLEKEKQLDEELRKSIQEFLRKGIEVDAEEDRKFGKDNNPYLNELGEGWKTKKERLEKIRAARKRLEERERAKAKAAGKEGAPIDPKAQINDAGYFSEDAIREVEGRSIDVYCPPDNGRTTERGACPRGRPPAEESFVEKMRRKVRSEEGKDHYRHRKFVVEPVFGQIKQGRGLRQFLLRGFGKVQAEWKLWSVTHNLRKLYLARVA